MNGQKIVKLGYISLCLTPILVMAQSSPPQIHPIYSEVGIQWTPPNNISTGLNTGSSSNHSIPSITGGDTLKTMMSQEWGQQAATNAEKVGINADALAATCMVESNCTNVTSKHGSITGAFQMTQGTYNEMIKEAMVDNPELRLTQEQINNGQNDPAIQAIAAAQYMKNAANDLQNHGIANPNSLDVRSYYNFGPKYGSVVAKADSGALMSEVLSTMSPSTLRANGINSSTTVGEWRNSVANKMGSSAYTSVLA